MSVEPCRISAVVPVHNGELTLGDTLESIRRQTLPPAEVLVIDDGSTDDSVGVAERHPLRPKVISLGANSGVAFARGVGLRGARSRVHRLPRLHDKSVLYGVHPKNASKTTDWPMSLMTAAAAQRFRGRVVPRGSERLPTDSADRRASGRLLVRALAAGAPVWVRSLVDYLRGVRHV